VAVNHADALALATPTPKGEISFTPHTVVWTRFILAAEVFDGMHRFSPKQKVLGKARLALLSVIGFFDLSL